MDPEFYGLPPAASTFAEDVDPLFEFLWIVCAFFFFLILGILAYSVIKYRRKTANQPAASNMTHHTTLEIVWTIIPTIILMVVFAWGWKGNLKQQVAPQDSLVYQVNAKQWGWDIYHPGADRPTTKEIWVPAGKPVLFQMQSPDVLHGMFIPAFRQKRDVVPGARQLMWFQANEDQVGQDYRFYCTEYCGEGHSRMNGIVHVVSEEEYAKKPWLGDIPQDPEAAGYYHYLAAGCSICHSLDGVKGQGPSFKGIWDRQGQLEDGGTYVANADDGAYIRQSILDPQSQIVKGYPRLMQDGYDYLDLPYLPDDERDGVSDIIAWMKGGLKTEFND